jgi:hypothetical protein
MNMNELPIHHRVVGYITVFLIILTQGLLLFWAFWPYEPLKIEYIQPIEFINGEKFTYRMRYVKYSPLAAEIGKQFVDGFVVSFPAVTGNVEIGENCTVHELAIPKLPPGSYYFKWMGTYKVNPIREVTVTARTAKFEVK